MLTCHNIRILNLQKLNQKEQNFFSFIFLFRTQTLRSISIFVFFFDSSSRCSYPDLGFIQLSRCFSLTSSHFYLFLFYFFSLFFQMNEMSRRWVTAKIWFIWFQNESGMWSSYFIQISFFFSAFSTKQIIFLPRSRFFSAFSSKKFIFLPRSRFVQLSQCFSLTSSHLYLFLFSFFFQMNEMSRRWVTTKIWFIWFQNESGMWSSYFIQISFFFSAFSTKQFIFLPRSRFFSVFSGKQFIFLLSFYLDLGFFKLSQANRSSSYSDLGFVQLSRCFSLTFHISTYFCFIFVFIFFPDEWNG